MTDDPLWYKDAVIYEVHVRTFHDASGSGSGDFRGLTQKLGYLEDLGVTALWVLPFYPSPLKDDGYDIADYTSVNPQYGTLDDFKEFLAEAHRVGLRVITELVINHTSDQHPWFQRARTAPAGSPERDFYVWSDTPDKYANVGLMFPDFETSNWAWDPVAKAYYWHRFYSHQPDLNYDNPAVWEAIKPVVDFWFGLGVDGMRLDAVPYLFEREGTSCEHLPETHAFLKALRKHADDKFPGRMFLAEANAWPEDAVTYFGDGDECHMAFHFPLMPRLFMSLHREDNFPILDMYAQTPAIPDTAQWCLFLRNHDEMTLAMVTDEERDSMFRAYAQDRRAKIFLGIRHRLAPLLQNDRRRIELMNALLFSLPGTPVVYYGDEIGMGDNIYLGDRNGVRTPMQWSADRNAGFSRANPQRLYLPVIIDPEYHYEAVNVEAQQNNPSSLLWWTKRLIAMRKRFRSFGRGTLDFVPSDNPKVLAFVRRFDGEPPVLVVANLSRFVQYAEIDLKPHAGAVPEELFGGSDFPAVADRPYPLTLAPHGFYWFALKPTATPAADTPLPAITLPDPWHDLSTGTTREQLQAMLPAFIAGLSAGDERADDVSVRIVDTAPLRFLPADGLTLFLRVEHRAADPETVLLPLLRLTGEQAERVLATAPALVLARCRGAADGILCDALALPAHADNLLRIIHDGRSLALPDGQLTTTRLAPFAYPRPAGEPPPTVRRTERNNYSVAYGSDLVLKVYRRIEEGANPDLEASRFLAAHGTFTAFAPAVGQVEYRPRGREPIALAVLHGYVPNQGTAWQHALDHLSTYFERVAALSREQPPAAPPVVPVHGPGEHTLPDAAAELLGGYLESVDLLGRRTAEMHAALACDPADPAFAPAPFDHGYQRSLYQTLRALTAKVFERLRAARRTLPDGVKELADRAAALRGRVAKECEVLMGKPLLSRRIRCHGDYHLANLLFTGNNFVVADFEGPPDKAVGERRIKRSPLRDVACMVRSFDYAVGTVLLGLTNGRGRAPGMIRPEDRGVLAPWADGARSWIARRFVAAYLEAAGPANLLPETPADQGTLLHLLTLERLLTEIESDLAHRPTWAAISLSALVARYPDAPA